MERNGCPLELLRLRDQFEETLHSLINLTSVVGNTLGGNDDHRMYFVCDFDMFCDCQLFSENLTNLIKEIMSENNESSKWDVFYSFIKKYTQNYHRMFSKDDIVQPGNCSLKLCSFFLNRLESCLHGGISLPNALRTVMPTICEKNLDYISNCTIQGLRINLNLSSAPETSAIMTALSDHSSFIKSLVKYDFISSSKDDSSVFEKESYCMICSFTRTWPGRPHDQNAKNVLNLTKKAFVHYKDGERFKRIFWATVAIRAIQLSLKKENSSAKRFVDYLKAYFTATTDPFLTIFEVRSLLYACFTVLEKLDLFDTYCQEFDKLMPECPVEIEPRKLKDLARCQMRKNLNKCHLPLPSAVDQLHLPDVLKNFVLGNIAVGISRKRKNISSQETVTRSKVIRLFCQ